MCLRSVWKIKIGIHCIIKRLIKNRNIPKNRLPAASDRWLINRISYLLKILKDLVLNCTILLSVRYDSIKVIIIIYSSFLFAKSIHCKKKTWSCAIMSNNSSAAIPMRSGFYLINIIIVILKRINLCNHVNMIIFKIFSIALSGFTI